MQTPILLVEDEHVDRLWPLAVVGAAFDVRCGGYSLWRYLMSSLQPASLRTCVREYLRPTVAAEFPSRWNSAIAQKAGWLLVNARCVPSPGLVDLLSELERDGQPVGLISDGECVAALMPAGTEVPARSGISDLVEWIRGIVPEREARGTAADWLLRYPHDVLRRHPVLLPMHLSHRIEAGGLREVRDGVYVGADVAWQEPVATESSAGPIVVEEGASIMPFVYLRGPLWIGPFCRIQAHATIKDGTMLGDHTRVGGEVTGAIIEPYSNKQHDGFLGHSYVGSWINLGAGTTNSDLKNSYGNVRIQVGQERVDSGMQLLGCVMGSYAKTAIHTRIMTGKLIGVNSLVYGTVSENIPDFVNYVSAREELTAVDLATAVHMQERMFARRDVQQQEYHRQLLRDVYQMTSPRRVGLRQGPPQL